MRRTPAASDAAGSALRPPPTRASRQRRRRWYWRGGLLLAAGISAWWLWVPFLAGSTRTPAPSPPPPPPSRTLWVYSHIPKTGGSSIGTELTKRVGAAVTCHTGQLLAWLRRSRGASNATVDANVLLVQWMRGDYDDVLPTVPLDERQPMKWLPPVPRFQDTSFVWAQHQDASVVALLQCLRPDVAVRGISWVRDPVERFYSSFYYAKYKYVVAIGGNASCVSE
jgi:hypothetical protein